MDRWLEASATSVASSDSCLLRSKVRLSNVKSVLTDWWPGHQSSPCADVSVCYFYISFQEHDALYAVLVNRLHAFAIVSRWLLGSKIIIESLSISHGLPIGCNFLFCPENYIYLCMALINNYNRLSHEASSTTISINAISKEIIYFCLNTERKRSKKGAARKLYNFSFSSENVFE